jgi:hypothetical protein
MSQPGFLLLGPSAPPGMGSEVIFDKCARGPTPGRAAPRLEDSLGAAAAGAHAVCSKRTKDLILSDV